jgi:hypothetical protein
MAISAWQLANLSGMIPRGPKRTVQPIVATKVTPELLRANR